MTREDAIQEVRERASCTRYLERSQGGMYCCPFCGSGKHKHGTGALSYYAETNTWHCFACDKTGDVIDLYQQHNGIDFNTALYALAAENGIEIERESAQADFSRADNKETTPQGRTAQRPDLKRGRVYYEQCTQALAQDSEAIAYLKGRGISLETAQAYGVGYDPAWRSPTALEKGKRPPISKRIIIPMDAAHYMARAIEPPRNDAEKRRDTQARILRCKVHG